MSDVATEMDQLRIALGEVDVLAAITRVAYDEAEWDGPDPLVVERIASLLGLIEKSTADAMAAFHRLHGAVADAAPVPVTVATERWDYDKGTSPGGEKPLPKQDAAIVRRLRTLSQDGRFNGYTDDALIHLFRRNQQAVGGTEEQIMDVMTRPEPTRLTSKPTRPSACPQRTPRSSGGAGFALDDDRVIGADRR